MQSFPNQNFTFLETKQNPKKKKKKKIYLSVKHSILGHILVKEDEEPFNRNNRIELSKLSKNWARISYLHIEQMNTQKH